MIVGGCGGAGGYDTVLIGDVTGLGPDVGFYGKTIKAVSNGKSLGPPLGE